MVATPLYSKTLSHSLVSLGAKALLAIVLACALYLPAIVAANLIIGTNNVSSAYAAEATTTPTISISNATAMRGSSITGLTVNSSKKMNAAGMLLRIDYDNTVFEFDGATLGAGVTDSKTGQAPTGAIFKVQDNGTYVNILLSNATNLTFNNQLPIFNLNFRVKDNAAVGTYQMTPLITAGNLCDEGGNSVAVDFASGVVTVDSDCTCEWDIDNQGTLTIKPEAGLSEGKLGTWDGNTGAPWSEFADSITSVVIEKGVSASTCCEMFSGCVNLRDIDISNLDVSSVSTMEGMFYGCTSLTTILDDGDFVVPAGCSTTNMFYDCTSLVGGGETIYDPDVVDGTYARIGSTELPGYFTVKHEHSPVLHEAVTPTCTTAGNYAYYECSICGWLFSGQECTERVTDEDITIPATGHDWDETTYTWDKDHSSCTAIRTCTKGDGTESVTTKVINLTTINPTCESVGYNNYSADFSGTEAEDWAVTEFDSVTIAALGHDYSSGTISFSDDGKSATATFICANDQSHSEAVSCAVTSEITTPATCSVSGTTTYTATATSSTGKELTATRAIQDVPTIAHTLVTDEAVAATCTEEGLTEGSHCSVCGTIIIAQQVTTALGHSFTDYVSNGDATCTTDGTKTAKCDRCDATDTQVDTGSAMGHDYSKGTLAFSDDGKSATAIFVCSNNADHTETGICAVNSQVTMSATCTENGITTYIAVATSSTGTTISGTCSIADLPALGHSFTEYVSNGDATCTADGTKTAKCDRCDVTDTQIDVGSALGHSFTNYVSNSDATCTTDGTKTAKCDRCDATDTQVDTGSATGHDYAKGTLSFSEDGKSATAIFVCSNNADHTETGTCAVNSSVTMPATCTENGITTYIALATSSTGTTISGTCSIADLPALGHSFTDYVSNGDATCTTDGTKTAKCDRCDVTDTQIDVGSALGHSFTDYISNRNATCTADGTKTAKCDRCDATDTQVDVGSALGHSFTNYVSDGNTTCTTDGTKTAKCDRCNAIDTVTESAFGHDFGEGEIAFSDNGKEATATFTCIRGDATEEIPCQVTSATKQVADCENAGITTYTATATSSTGIVITDTSDVIDTPALGHVSGDTTIENVITPTCTENGSHDEVTYCSVCGNETARIHVIDDAIGHQWGDWTFATATDDAPLGTMTSSCAKCETKRMVKLGDSNCDDTIDVRDLVLMQRLLAGLSEIDDLTEEAKVAANINQDVGANQVGIIDQKDIDLLVAALLAA